MINNDSIDALEQAAPLSAAASPQHMAVPDGWKLVPVQPTPEIIAGAAIASWPTATLADIDLARQAAPLVLMQMDMAAGTTVDALAGMLATMAPAYRAMLAAAPKYSPLPAAAPQVVADERAARIESALARLLASDPTTAACSENDLSAAVNDASAPPFVREQAAAMLMARAALAAAPVQPVAAPDDAVLKKALIAIRDRCHGIGIRISDDVEKMAIAALAAPAAQGDAVKLECCGLTEFCERAACPAQGDAKELTDDEIVQAVRSVGVDTHPSKFGFLDEQIQGMSVTVLRQVIAAIAAKAAS